LFATWRVTQNMHRRLRFSYNNWLTYTLLVCAAFIAIGLWAQRLMSFDWIMAWVIPVQVMQIGSLPWLLAMLIALNFGAAVIALRAVCRAYIHARRAAHVRALLMNKENRR
jgi:hypothetical protein